MILRLLCILTASIVLLAFGRPEQQRQPSPTPTISELVADAKPGTTITLPPGDFVINEPLILSDVDRVKIEGSIETRLIYRGPPTAGIVQFRRAYECRLSNMTIVSASTGVKSAVLITNLPPPSPTGRISSYCVVNDVIVWSDNDVHQPKYGFSVDSFAAGGQDANNDFHEFRRCNAASYETAAFHVLGGQSHQLKYDRCRAFNHRGLRQYGWYFEYGAYFASVDCFAAQNKVDYMLGNFLEQVVIERHNSEWSRQFVVFGSTGAATNTVIRNCRWDGIPGNDDAIIAAWTQGPLSITDNVFRALNGQSPVVWASCYQDVVTWKRFNGSADVSRNRFETHFVAGDGNGKSAPSIALPEVWSVTTNGNLSWVNKQGERHKPAQVIRTP